MQGGLFEGPVYAYRFLDRMRMLCFRCELCGDRDD